jgi:peptidoglycan/LPS O-acetylase OafA/YrhL
LRSARSVRLPSLTALRGIAAMCVLLHHATGFLLPTLGDDLAGTTAFFRRSYLWVDFFFILSGFLLTWLYSTSVGFGYSARAYGGFLRARFARIYPLHFATLFAMLGVNLAMVAAEIRSTGLDVYLAGENFAALRFYGNDTVATFIQHLLLVHALNVEGYTSWNGPAWSIGSEWVAYVLFPLLVMPAVRWSGVAVVCSVGVAMGGLVALEHAFGGSLDLGGVWGTLRCLCGFTVGAAVARALRSGRAPALIRSDAAFATAAFAVVLILHLEVPPTMAILPFGFLVLAGAANTGAVARGLDHSLLSWLGERSYSIYMIHWLVLVAARWLWQGIFQEELGASFGPFAEGVTVAAYLVVVLVLAELSWRWVEVPWRRRLRGNTAGPASEPASADRMS